MAEIGYIDFDAIPENDGFAAIPAGDYTVAITESEVSDNKKGNGKYVKFTFQVIDGQYKGRNLWHYVNFKHVNPTTQNIGQRELKELGLACGVSQFADTSVLYDTPIRVKVAVEKDNQGQDRNVIKRVLWKETGGGSGTPSAAAAAKPQPATIDDQDIPF